MMKEDAFSYIVGVVIALLLLLTSAISHNESKNKIEETTVTTTVAETTTATEIFIETTITETEPIVENLHNPNLDFKQASNVSADKLAKGLKHNLVPLADAFVEIENEYGINSILFASMVALESGWGTSELSQTNNNITSHVDLSSDNNHKYYPSKEACLFDMAEILDKCYFDSDGIYHLGSSKFEDIACYYLVGKPYSDMNNEERTRYHNYIETVEEIYYQILDRMEQI